MEAIYKIGKSESEGNVEQDSCEIEVMLWPKSVQIIDDIVYQRGDVAIFHCTGLKDAHQEAEAMLEQ